MYKVVNKFYSTNIPIDKLIKEYGNSKEPVEEALLLVLFYIDTNISPDEDTYNKIDDAVKNGHPDQEMFLIFIIYLLNMYNRDLKNENKRGFIYDKSNSVYRISCGMGIKSYRPETQAYYYQSSSNHFYVRGNFIKGDELALLSISLMPKECTRYLDFIGKLGQIIGYDGRLLLIPNLEQELFRGPQKDYYFCCFSLFFNSLFTVNMDSITKYYTELITNFKEIILSRTERINCVIEVLKGNLEETQIDYPAMNICLAYYKSLKDKDFDSAKRLYYNISTSSLHYTCYHIFYFAEYHHSFVTGWFENIETVIKNKEENSYHYMLDFFVARYFLLKNKKDLARFYFAQLLKNCERYNAIGRLKFEMQFAIELSLSSFLDFTYQQQGINSADLKKSLEIAMISSPIDLFGLNRIIGKSKAINEVKKKIKLFSDTQRPILLIGETGAGKEILAQAIHEESKYKNKPFLAINCGALTDTLLQSELFGYESGAFTGAIGTHKGIFEAAENGVVFLDEFGEMSPKLQVSLLRILENNEVLRVGGTKVKEIKCRIIAATNANIEDLIQKKLFREDLYYRLKQFSVIIPPLRDRIEDIPELINYFLNLTNKDQAQIFSNEVMLKFQEYHWPGNIRELKNEIDRIKILCGNKPVIELNDLDIEWIEKKNTLNKKSSPSNSRQTINEQMHQRIMAVKLSSTDKRNQQIILLFQQYKQLNRIQIANALEVSLLTITRDLKRLCEEGVIVKRMPTLSPKSHFFEIKDS